MLIDTIVRYLDSLLYTKITTVTTVTTWSDPPITTVTPTTTAKEAKVDSICPPIPDATLSHNVRTRPPLILPDGALDYTAFPRYRNAPLVVCFTGNGKKFAAYDGYPLSRNTIHRGYSRQKAFVMVSNAQNIADHHSSTLRVEASVDFSDLTLRYAVHTNWIYLEASGNDGTCARFYQPNIGQFDHPADRMDLAFGYARALLLTYGAVEHHRDTIADEATELSMANALHTLFTMAWDRKASLPA